MADIDLARVKRNVAKMAAQGAPEADIDGYIASEGTSVDAVRAFNPAATAKPPRREARGPNAGLTGQLMRGVSFGWSDEIAGLAGGIADFTKGKGFKAGYDRAKTQANEDLKAYEEENPVTSATAQIVGGLGSMSPVAGFAAAPTLAGRAVQGARVGAPMGAVAGAGGAEGDAVDVAQAAATGGVLGAGVGAALPAVTQGIAAGARHGANALGLRPAPAVAREKMAAMLARDGVTPQQMLARIDDGAGAKPEMLMDLGGEATRRGVRVALGRPGEASSRGTQALTERHAGQGERLADDLTRLSGVDDFAGTMRALERQRSAASAPLYRQAFDDPSPVWNERIQQFIDSPEARQGLRQGLMIQRREALASGQRFDPRSYGVTGFNEAGEPIIAGTPNLRTLDAIKRGMDDMLEQYRDKTTGRLVLDEAGRALNSVRRAYVQEVDAAAPEVYRQARAAWSGPSQARDAMEAGRGIFNRRPEQIRDRLGTMSEGEREFFRAGAVRALRDRIEATPDGADAVRRFFDTPRKREALAAAFPSEASFRAFERAMQRETAMLRNARFVSPNTGSQTFLRQAEAADANPSAVMEAAGAMLQGQSPRNAILGTIAGRTASRVGGYTPEVSNEIVGALMSTNPARQREAIQGLLNYEPVSRGLMDRAGQRRLGLLSGSIAPFGSRD